MTKEVGNRKGKVGEIEKVERREKEIQRSER